MRKKNIEAFLVTHDDEHLLENTAKSFERLKLLNSPNMLNFIQIRVFSIFFRIFLTN